MDVLKVVFGLLCVVVLSTEAEKKTKKNVKNHLVDIVRDINSDLTKLKHYSQAQLQDSVQRIDTKAEFDQVLQINDLVMVDFFAVWCGPCRMIAPKIEEMEKEYTDIKFIIVDVDENDEIAQSAGIISDMPTFKFYKNGVQVGELVGANEMKIREELDKLLQ